MKVTIKRSSEWVKQQRILTGTNVPETINVDVDPQAMSQTGRENVLLIACGQYPAEIKTVDYAPNNLILRCTPQYMPYRSLDLLVDSDTPTVEQVETAIHAAIEEARVKQREYQAEQEARAARESRIQEARELLSDEFALLNTKLLSATAQTAVASGNVTILSEFLSEVPLDALRGTAKRLAGESASELIAKVENAANVYVFERD